MYFNATAEVKMLNKTASIPQTRMDFIHRLGSLASDPVGHCVQGDKITDVFCFFQDYPINNETGLSSLPDPPEEKGFVGLASHNHRCRNQIVGFRYNQCMLKRQKFSHH